MRLGVLQLRHFRCYDAVELEFSEGLTAIVGSNGFGKTNLVEAMNLLSTGSSFRGAPIEAMVGREHSTAIIRGEVHVGQRRLWIESELQRSGRSRTLLNSNRARRRDTQAALCVTVFSPSDLELIQGGPSARRAFLDDVIVAVDPAADSDRSGLDRILRQRNALLKSARGRLDNDAAFTLEIWDRQWIAASEAWAARRTAVLAQLAPLMSAAYSHVAAGDGTVDLGYVAPWMDVSMATALATARDEEVRRGITLVGPHRDEVFVGLHGLAARSHASQGEQRSLALAAKLAAHRLVETAVGAPPVLILDDVFSELDERRRRALLGAIPAGQVVLTSASDLPPEVHYDKVLNLTARGALT